MKLPLENIVVVELGHSVAAPIAGLVLAELGATVIKIENPQGGDDARNWGPPFLHGAAGMFQAINRNKRSAAIDLKDDAERETLRALHRRSRRRRGAEHAARVWSSAIGSMPRRCASTSRR